MKIRCLILQFLRQYFPDCREQLTRLFTLAEESSEMMQAAASNPAAFWKSKHTQSVIEQEEALKRHLYLQMLHGAAA